jgi:dethiobiotin synthetase
VNARARILFVTGTDTGVGKTIFATSMVWYLRGQGVRALGIKPFCSGSHDDVKLLQRIQEGELTHEEVNPFYFPEAVAPLISARKHRRKITLAHAIHSIRAVQRKCDVLIVEGSGGLLVPLGKDFMVADLIKALNCELIVVSRNRLGTINHTLLTVNAARKLSVQSIKAVLMDCGHRDDSTATNFEVLHELLAPISIIRFPFLGRKPASLSTFRRRKKILQKVLAVVLN